MPHVENPDGALTHENFYAQCLSLLEFLADSAQVPWQTSRAREVLLQVERDTPGSWQSTWSKRLKQVGADLGMLVDSVTKTVAQATDASQSQPLIAFVSHQWIILDCGRVGTVASSPEKTVQWRSSSELATLVGVTTGLEESAIEWVRAGPSQPCEPLHQNAHNRQDHGPPPLRRLFALMRQERNDIWVIVLFSLGIGIFSLATPIAVEAIVSTVQGGTQILLQPVIALSIVLLVFLGLAAILRVMKAFVVEYLQQRLFVRVVVDLANRLPQVRQDTLDKEHGPELVNRFFDVLTIQKAGAVLLVDGLSVLLQTTIGLMVLAFFNPYLLGFDLVLIGAISFIIFVLGQGAVRTSIGESYAKYEVAGWLEEIVRHPLTFKLAGGRQYALLRANQLASEYIHARRSHFKILFRQILFALLLQAFASAALFGLGGWLVINRGLTLGQLVAAELILAMIVGSLIKLGKSLESYYDLMAGVDKLGHLIDLPLEKESGESLSPTERPAALALRAMSFDFTESASTPLLDHLNVTLTSGEHLAIIGRHGFGKSTLLDLLYGLREPRGGRIELDGVDLRHLRLESLRAQVSLVKGVEIFEGTISQNVTVGRPFSAEDVRQALRLVALLEEVQLLHDGLQTPLSTGGIPLSYGQVRRLMIARAIINQPRLLLIDEALDDLHESIRDQILQNLTGVSVPWTMVVATHSEHVAQRCAQQLQLN